MPSITVTPPAIWDGQHNAAPERTALLAIVSAAEHAEAQATQEQP